MMRVVLGFLNERGRTPETIRYAMYGKYSMCTLIFVGEAEIECFYSVPGGVFSKYVITKGYNQTDFEADFLLLSLDEEEKRLLRLTCETCALVKKPYNLRDVLMLYAPFSGLFADQRELGIDEAPVLNNSQAVILFLRECLNCDNPLRRALDGLHSRQTFICALHERLASHALPVEWSSLVGQLRKS
jgi:hypothetical protein